MRVTLHYEVDLNDLIVILQESSKEGLNVKQFIDKCIREYIQRKISKPVEKKKKS